MPDDDGQDDALNEESNTPTAFVKPETPNTESVLDLDELMSAGRRVERTARFCIDGNAYARLLELDEEIAEIDTSPGYGDPDDEPMSGDELTEKAAEREQVLEQVQNAMRTVRVRALPDEEWRALLRKYDHDRGKALPNDKFWDELLVKCAIRPTLDDSQVAKLRSTLGMAQFNELQEACYAANAADGVDIPKLPSSLREMKRRVRASS